MDLLERIDAWGRLAPDRLAYVSPCGQLTYAELKRGSDALAAFIQAALGDDRSPIVVVGHKEPELLLGFLGSVKAGRAYVPMDTSQPAQRLAQVLDRSQAQLVLTPETIRDGIGQAPESAPHLEAVGDDDIWYVMFTSGSSGEPKGVTITRACLTSFVVWMLGEQRFGEAAEVFLNQAPFSFDLSVMDTYLSLVTGGKLFSVTSDQIAYPRRLYEALHSSRLTTWVSTPSFAQLCLAEPRFDARMSPTLGRFLFCGETLSPSLAAQLLERFPQAQVWNTYGPTEATVATTSICIDHDVLRRYPELPVGRAKPPTRVLVVDQDGASAWQGERGEVIIAGPNVSPGYLNQPDLTRRSFFELDGFQAYRTGDRGHMEGELLFFDGRMDDQIKLHGYRIEPGDIESNLRRLPYVRDAVVVALFRGSRVDALAAFVIPEPGAFDTPFEATVLLRRGLAERVPAYMLPRVVQTVDSFPMTSNGKVDRRALAASLA